MFAQLHPIIICDPPWESSPLFIPIIIENERHFFLFGSFAKQSCICNAATLSEAETFQGQITQ